MKNAEKVAFLMTCVTTHNMKMLFHSGAYGNLILGFWLRMFSKINHFDERGNPVWIYSEGYEMTDQLIGFICDYDSSKVKVENDVTVALKILEDHGFIKKKHDRIVFPPFWKDRFSDTKAVKWAKKVKERDGYKCQKCGSTENLQAHHIVPWLQDDAGRLRYDLNNGVTLCRTCHLKAHGGCWKNV